MVIHELTGTSPCQDCLTNTCDIADDMIPPPLPQGLIDGRDLDLSPDLERILFQPPHLTPTKTLDAVSEDSATINVEVASPQEITADKLGGIPGMCSSASGQALMRRKLMHHSHEKVC